MSLQDKLDMMDLVITALKDQEKRLDAVITRLEVKDIIMVLKEKKLEDLITRLEALDETK